MNNTRWRYLIALVALILVACSQTPGTPLLTPTSPTAPLSQSEAKYRLIAEFGGVFYCDPDYYPIARVGREEEQAASQFLTIRADQEEFTAILKHNALQNTSSFPSDVQLLVYREHKKLSAIKIALLSEGFRFSLRVGQKSGFAIEGNIDHQGKIQVIKKESVFNTCPICLSGDTLIETPNGLVPVRELSIGMTVWTADLASNRIPGVIQQTMRRQILAGSQLLRLRLDDGREVIASAGHPSADGRPLGSYRPGDMLHGSRVESVNGVAVEESETYDVLPSGPTGYYWANGILLSSTLSVSGNGR